MKLIPAILLSVSAMVSAPYASLADAAGYCNSIEDFYEFRPTVYFTSEITPESLVRIFNALNIKPSANDRTAVKISTGEAGGHNYLKPELISNLVSAVKGTIVECNTAYGGSRSTSEAHWKTILEHGFTKIAKVEILDEFGEIEIPVRDKTHIKADLVGAGLTNYTFLVNLAHFKGHVMGGFGGVLKNQSIGIASANGKARIHSAGKTDNTGKLWSSLPAQDAFLESMASAAQGVHDYFGGGKIVYINVLNNISVDCDCSAHPATPKMKDIGIMASLDPVALDQACVDMVMQVPVTDDNDNRPILERIEGRHGTHIISHAAKIGLGYQHYTLVSLGDVNKAGTNGKNAILSVEAAIGMIRRGEAECLVLGLSTNGSPYLLERASGRGITPFLDIHDKYAPQSIAQADNKADGKGTEISPLAGKLKNSIVVDKIIGRAAAFIAISAGVRYVHGEIMCVEARDLLESKGIETTYTLLVPQIRDRSKLHLCPLEDSVTGITDTSKALEAIRKRVADLRSGKKIATPALPTPSRTLVTYFSKTGVTESAAEIIAKSLNADIFRIAPFSPYPYDYESTHERVRSELTTNARPGLFIWPVGFPDYDTIFIGSPVWCGKLAPPVATFISVADLDSKKIVPFFTHGGGGAKSAASDFASRFPKAILTGIGEWFKSDINEKDIAVWAENTIRNLKTVK